MDGDALNVLNVRGAQEETRDGAGQAQGAHDLPHGLFARGSDGGPQSVGVGAGHGVGDGQQVEAVADQVDDLAGKIQSLVVAAGNDGRVHAPVVGDDVLEVVVGNEEHLELAVRDGERDEG